MSTKQRTQTVARVYNQNDEHVADLHSPELYHEFSESPEWEVDLVDEKSVDYTEIISKED